jgi:hemerythrin-like domain-containing protein
MLREKLGLSDRLMMDLHEDHQKVAELIEEALGTEAQAKRNQLFGEIKDLLVAHSKAEEKVVYKRLQKSKDDEIRKFAMEAEVEHGVVEELLEQLGRMRGKTSEQWEAKFTVLKELVQHHVEEEEKDGFDYIRSECEGEEIDKMADQFERAKEKLLA